MSLACPGSAASQTQQVLIEFGHFRVSDVGGLGELEGHATAKCTGSLVRTHWFDLTESHIANPELAWIEWPKRSNRVS